MRRVVLFVGKDRVSVVEKLKEKSGASNADVNLVAPDFHKDKKLVSTGYDYAMPQWDLLHGFADAPSVRWM